MIQPEPQPTHPQRRRWRLDHLDPYLRQLRPGRRAWRGALWGSLAYAVVIIGLAGSALLTTAGVAVDVLLGLAAGALVTAALVGLSCLIRVLLRPIPAINLCVGLALLLVLSLLLALGALLGGPIVALLVLLVASLTGAGVATLAARRPRSTVQRGIAIAGVIVGLAATLYGALWFAGEGFEREPPVNALALGTMPPATLAAPDPSLPGPHPVAMLTYGSGTDLRRSEYATDVDLVSRTVDGTPFLESWRGLRATLREAYWGFGPDALPLNARVWYPADLIENPEVPVLPLVLMVHGNALMEKPSDAGYDYLGELFASRGYIALSIDENFLNLSLARGLDLPDSTDARAWLLLEHLRLWQEWHASPDHLFSGRVDLDRVAMIGHSRGGEAVAVAALFNGYTHYPDDATVSFDYGFGIRAIAAIAPVDGQYQPAGAATPLENLNYFVIHGAQDNDVQSYMGLDPYYRLRFTDENDWFKAGLYVYGANHGQFNTEWGRYDVPDVMGGFLNVRTLMPAEEQRQLARVYLSAFVEATLGGRDEYRELFRDPRAGAAWLPETVYMSQYADSDITWIANHQEDLNPGTTTLPGGSQRGIDLLIWRQQPLRLRLSPADTHAVLLGWDRAQGRDPHYLITLPDDWRPDPDGVLTLTVAEANQPLPVPDSGQPTEGRAPLDFTIELVDGAGRVASLPLSAIAPVQPPIEGPRRKAPLFDLRPASEPIPQTYWLPIDQVVAGAPEFTMSDIAEIRFRFDQSPAGVIYLNDVGFGR